MKWKQAKQTMDSRRVEVVVLCAKLALLFTPRLPSFRGSTIDTSFPNTR